MRESICLARFWGDTLLDVTVVPIARQFRLGPFRGRARWEGPWVPPLPTARPAPAAVTLEGLSGSARVTVSVPPRGVLRLADGPVTLHVSRGPAAAQVGWRPTVDPNLVLALLFATLVSATFLFAAARSIPALGELADLVFVRTRVPPLPMMAGLRRARWAQPIGPLPGDGVVLNGAYQWLERDFPDCRDEPLPPCPRGTRALTVAAARRRADLADEPVVVVDGRLEPDPPFGLRLVEVRSPATTRPPASLALRPLSDCARSGLGRRVLVRVALSRPRFVFARESGDDDPLRLDLDGVCAVVAGTEPSAATSSPSP